MIRIKRAYEPISKDDGYRILVERLWPRGLTKNKAKIDLWLKDIAPSTELRKWFSHDPEKWNEFRRKYRKEISSKRDIIEQIRKIEKEKKKVDLIYSSKEDEYNCVNVLFDLIKR